MKFTGSWDRYIPLIELAYTIVINQALEWHHMRLCMAGYVELLCIGTKLNKHKVIGPDIVKDTEAKVQVIRQRLKAVNDRQKSYADLKMKDIEYEVGDKVFLKVSPWRKVLRFRKKGKLSPRFIGPYEVSERIGLVAYQLTLPPELAKLHDVFHVSMLRKYCFDESHILPIQDIQVQPDFTFDEEPKAILDREVKQLRNKQVPLVKVLWQHHSMEEATWEPESTMRAQYPKLFNLGNNFDEEIILRGGEF